MSEMFCEPCTDEGAEVNECVFCQPCNDEGNQVNAFAFCLDCNEYLCQECRKFHLKFRQTKHHTLLEGEHMLEHKPENVTVSDACTDICPDHSGENIKYFCADHDVVCCSVCIITDHRNCDGVDHIPQVVQGLSDKEDWKTIDDIEPLVRRLDSAIATSKTNIAAIEEGDTEVTNAIDNYRAEISTILNKLKKASKEKAEMFRAIGIDKMNSYIDNAGEFLKKLRGLEAKVSQFKEQKQYCKLFIAVKELRKSGEEIQNALEEIEVGNCIKTLYFETDKELRSCINSMSTLGILLETNLSQGDQLRNCSDSAEPIEDDTMQTADIEVSSSYDKDMCVLSDFDRADFCNVNSLTVLSDDKIVISDSGNCVLKMVNVKNNKIISKLSHNGKRPYAVMKIQNEKLAVVYEDSLVIVQAKSQLIKERVLLNSRPTTMSFCNSSGYIYYCGSTCISKIDIHGRQTTVLTMKKDGHGDAVHPLSSAVNATIASHGYVYAIIKNCGFSYYKRPERIYLAMVLPDGSIKEEIKIPDTPERLECDETGSLLFVLAKDVIYTLRVGSTEAKVLLTKEDGLCNAQSLAYDNCNKKLYVGMKDNNFFKVYTLSGI